MTEDHCVCSYELTEGDPLSAVARLEGHSDLVRGAELDVRVDTLSELRATPTSSCSPTSSASTTTAS